MKANEMTPEKQKSDVELLASVISWDAIDKDYAVEQSEVLEVLRLKSQQLQVEVDELKQRCEELEKYAIHKPNCARLQRPFGASVTVCNDSITCTCGLDKLINPSQT